MSHSHLISDTAEDHCIYQIGLHKVPVKPLWENKIDSDDSRDLTKSTSQVCCIYYKYNFVFSFVVKYIIDIAYFT